MTAPTHPHDFARSHAVAPKAGDGGGDVGEVRGWRVGYAAVSPEGWIQTDTTRGKQALARTAVAVERLAPWADLQNAGWTVRKVIVSELNDYSCSRGRAPGLAELDGWQPIETAPRDETYLLLCDPLAFLTTIVAGFWSMDSHCWVHSWDCKPIEDYQPTHWMPLPAPPVTP